MKPGGLWFFPFLPVSVLLASLAPAAPASTDRDNREVRISFVWGDVRLSRGDGKHPDLNQSWEEAQSGQLLEQGFAVATGSGRAEIELENGSTVFLAENSLLLLRKLSFPGERVVTDMTLPTGSASFWLQMAEGESFLLETPTDKMHFSGPHIFFLRFDAYLDATAITPLGGKLGELVRKDTPNLTIGQGQTVFFQGGGVLLPPPPDSDETLPSNDSIPSDLALGLPIRAVTAVLRDSGMSLPPMFSEDVFSLDPAGRETNPAPESESAQSRPGDQLLDPDWDQWVEARVREKETTLTAALKASGLSSPVPGLADLYLHGTFSPCQPYGTCWEAAQSQSLQESVARPGPADAEGASPNPASPGFRPQTVQWQEPEWSGPCNFLGGSRTMSSVARTPEEFKELLRRKSLAESNVYHRIATQESCYRRPWIYRHGHYAMVLPRTPPKCFGPECKPVRPPHPRHPVFVRVGDKVGFVPRHPDDAKNKTPGNLKNGIILLASKPGEAVARIAWDPSQKLIFLDKSPREFERESASPPVAPVAAPQIRAHLMQEATQGNSLIAANHLTPRIEYDYKTREFTMPAAATSGAKSIRVPVGEIASNGKIATFASGQSRRFADSFGRTSAAASYSGSNYGSRSFSSGSSGGSSSHSSSSGSYGGSSSHSSGGGGASASSSGGSSSPASSGGSHPR